MRQPFKDPLGKAANIFFRQAYAYAVSIIISGPEDPRNDIEPEIYSASAVIVRLGGKTLALTCNHVVLDFEKMKASNPHLRFQVGREIIDPLARLHARDEAFDLYLIDVSDFTVAQLNNRVDYALQPIVPARWPPPLPTSNEIVVVCGYPKSTREVSAEGRSIVSVAFDVIEHVKDVDSVSFTVPFDRVAWVDTARDLPVPAASAVDLPGLSGCPVFAGRDIGGIRVLELLGVVITELPFGIDGVRVRSTRCIGDEGLIKRP